MIKELKQLEEGPMPGKIVVPAIDPDILSSEDKANSLNSMNLIKQKRYRTIKVRTCADGSKHKICLGKDEIVASPNVYMDSLFTTLVIDAYKERDIATFDIPGAYLHAKIPADKGVILKLCGRFVDIICNINE